MRSILFHRWEHWWLRPAPPHALAILRIAVGAFLLCVWLRKAPQVPMLFSDRGLTLPLWPGLAPPTAVTAFVIYGVFLVSLLLFTCGVAMRWSGSVALLINVYTWGLSLHLFNTSFDRLFLFLLLVLTLSGADRTLSWRAWRRLGSMLAWEPVTILPQRLIALQITAVYLGVGLQKLWLPDWESGDIVPASMLGPWGSPLAFALVRQNFPIAVYDVAVFLVKFFEVAIPAGLWVPRLRRWFILGGALFHGAIALLLHIPWFLILIPAYIVFLEPEAVKRWCEMSFRFDSRSEKNNGS